MGGLRAERHNGTHRQHRVTSEHAGATKEPTGGVLATACL